MRGVKLRLLGSVRLRAPALEIGSPAMERSAAHAVRPSDAFLKLGYFDLWHAYKGQPLHIEALEAAELDANLERQKDGQRLLATSARSRRTNPKPDDSGKASRRVADVRFIAQSRSRATSHIRTPCCRPRSTRTSRCATAAVRPAQGCGKPATPSPAASGSAVASAKAASEPRPGRREGKDGQWQCQCVAQGQQSRSRTRPVRQKAGQGRGPTVWHHRQSRRRRAGRWQGAPGRAGRRRDRAASWRRSAPIRSWPVKVSLRTERRAVAAGNEGKAAVAQPVRLVGQRSARPR